MAKCHRCAWHEHLRDHCEQEPGYPNGCDQFRPKRPPVWQGCLCVVGILGLYVFLMFLEPIVDAFLMWLDKLPAEDVRFVLLAVPCALVAGLWVRRVRRG